MSEMLDRLMHLFVDTVTLQKKTGVDLDGYPVFDAGTVYKARVTGKITNVLGADGQEHVTSIIVTFPGHYGVTTDDQIIVPERFTRKPSDPSNIEARSFQPLAVESLTGREGAHHQKAYL